MNEADLILAWGEISAHLWTIIQFWASISFGIIAVAHFAPENLNRFLVVLLIALYTLFSVYCAGLFISDIELLLALYKEAEAALAQRTGEAIFLSAFINYPPSSGAPFILIGLPLVYLGCIAYLIHRYRGVISGGHRKAS